MKKNVIGYCPVCKKKLFVKTLRCNDCETEITGEFEMSPFDYLTEEQKNFALVFIMSDGNIKEIERKLNISYPTVKKNMDELKSALGVKVDSNPKEEKLEVIVPEVVDTKDNNKALREDVKRRLKNGEIDFDEAERILGESL